MSTQTGIKRLEGYTTKNVADHWPDVQYFTITKVIPEWRTIDGLLADLVKVTVDIVYNDKIELECLEQYDEYGKITIVRDNPLCWQRIKRITFSPL